MRAAIAAALLAPLALLAMPAGAAAAQQTEPAPEILVTAMAPAVPPAGSVLTLSGTVTNPTAAPYHDLQVQLRLSARLTGRSEISAVVSGDEIEKASSVIRGSATDVAARLEPGAQLPWRVAVDVDVLGLRTAGVHVLTVELLARPDDARRPQVVADTPVFLPWQGAGTAATDPPLQVSWLLPLVDVPRRDPEGVFVDDGLTADLAPTGRLGGLLAAGAEQGVTWVVDPDLLETVADMTDGYNVRDPVDPSRTQPGTGAEVAAAWLAQATTLLGAGPASSVVTTAYADPDVVALRRADRTDNLTYATTLGPEIARTVLGRDVTADLAWPPDGLADDDTLAALQSAGARGAIVSDQLVPPAPSVTFTPTGRAALPTPAGQLDGLVVDAAASSALDPSTRPSLAAARQELLAQTLMIARERPTIPRTVLLAPPRRWAASPEWASTLLAADAQAAWTTRVPLATLRAEAVPDVPRDPVSYPATAQDAELPQDYLADVADVQAALRTVDSLLADPSAGTQFDEGIVRAESSAWRGRPESGVALLAQSAQALSEVEGGVRLVAGQDVILGGHEGTFGVSIANDLPDQAVEVALRVTPRNSAALRVKQPDPVTIQPGRTTQVTVAAAASANGLVDVDLQLVTPSGQPFGSPVPIQIRATEYGTLAAFITGAAMAVLFLAAAVRLTRRALRRRARTRTSRRNALPVPSQATQRTEPVEERIEETTP
jgi:Family of unknown function (DUF6049)